jgi:tetratricopeptide (TPR) repeat protein
LVFEKDDTKYSPDQIPAAMLGELLRKHSIPVMVLNACQSAMHTNDPFTSVAVSLLRAGIRGVVAMSYSLWVRGAEVFVPEFYRNLFQAGDLADAMQAGRREMYRNQMRNTSFGQEEFQDWMVPVLYQQEAEGILPKLDPGERHKSGLPSEMRYLGDYGFIGRDSAIQKLERAIRNKPAGILIHGMAGEGKTTLAKGFLRWLEDTHGLGRGAFWFSFEDIHSGEYIIDDIAGKLYGTEALTLPLEQKMAGVIQALRENRYFIVWDNFESATGIPGTEVSALIEKEDDRNLLKQLLHGLRGGQSKVIITSRSTEKWLTPQECFRLPLEGLRGEELWQYCNEIVTDLGLSLDRESRTYIDLMEKLEGNPLAVRAILLRLQEKSAATLLAELEEDFNGYEGDEGTRRIQSALQVFERGLDRTFAPALRLIGLHEHFLLVDLLEVMLQDTEENTVPLKNCLATLESAGLCQHIGNNIYKIHPALRGCLTRLHPARESDLRAFVDVMGRLADIYAPKELHEQRDIFMLFSASFYRALHIARKMDMRMNALMLMLALAAYAENIRNYSEAGRLYIQYAEYGEEKNAAIAYHQLGMIAGERRDFETAEGWYQKSLEIKLKQGNEHGAASTYHQLGMIAQERRDFETAEGWYQKSLEIKLKQGNEHGAASTYHQLGRIAEERRDFETAEGWYQKSLEISLKQGNEHGAALTYHQLGMIAEERRDFETAEGWYQKSLEINLKQGNEHGAAITYHQLGSIAQDRRDFETAEGWYQKSLEIKLKQGNEHGAART